jgi:hypothetical protein
MTSVETSDKRRVFCARLKSERERRGRSLAEIAASTKIKASLLDALERGDLSRWPKGIYRRSFFRDYVADIGLHPDPFVSEFLDVFAEAAPPSSATAGAAASAASLPSEPVSFRIVFADNVRSATPVSPAARDLTREARLVAALVDVLAVAAVAAVVAAVAPVSFPVMGGALGAICYLLFTWFETTPGILLLRSQARPAAASPVQAFAPSSLPYNTYAPTSGPAVQTHVTLAFRIREAIAGSLERVIEAASVLFNSQRRRELADIRRRRAEAASSTTTDEFSVT